jgi:flagellar assembly factor FliW
VEEYAQIPEKSIIHFPEGIPGFEGCKRFVILEPNELAPLLLLHTTEGEAFSLPVLPVQVVEANYQLKLHAVDRKLLGLAEEAVVGRNVVCLAVLVLPGAGSPPTCNLMAPIVINPGKLLAKQIVQVESEYSTAYPLPLE